MRRDKNIIKREMHFGWGHLVIVYLKKSVMKITRFIHNTQSVLKLLPLGHRWRGDVEVL